MRKCPKCPCQIHHEVIILEINTVNCLYVWICLDYLGQITALWKSMFSQHSWDFGTPLRDPKLGPLSATRSWPRRIASAPRTTPCRRWGPGITIPTGMKVPCLLPYRMTDPYVWYTVCILTWMGYIDGKCDTINMAYIRILWVLVGSGWCFGTCFLFPCFFFFFRNSELTQCHVSEGLKPPTR